MIFIQEVEAYKTQISELEQAVLRTNQQVGNAKELLWKYDQEAAMILDLWVNMDPHVPASTGGSLALDLQLDPDQRLIHKLSKFHIPSFYSLCIFNPKWNDSELKKFLQWIAKTKWDWFVIYANPRAPLDINYYLKEILQIIHKTQIVVEFKNCNFSVENFSEVFVATRHTGKLNIENWRRVGDNSTINQWFESTCKRENWKTNNKIWAQARLRHLAFLN